MGHEILVGGKGRWARQGPGHLTWVFGPMCAIGARPVSVRRDLGWAADLVVVNADICEGLILSLHHGSKHQLEGSLSYLTVLPCLVLTI